MSTDQVVTKVFIELRKRIEEQTSYRTKHTISYATTDVLIIYDRNNNQGAIIDVGNDGNIFIINNSSQVDGTGDIVVQMADPDCFQKIIDHIKALIC